MEMLEVLERRMLVDARMADGHVMPRVSQEAYRPRAHQPSAPDERDTHDP